MSMDPQLPEPTATCPHCEGVGKVFDDHRAVGQEMRRRREAKGLPRWDLATRMGYSDVYLDRLEAGKEPWTLSLVRRYWVALEAQG